MRLRDAEEYNLVKIKIETDIQDHLNTLKARLQKQERAFQQENASLTDDHNRLTEQFRELQKKFRHFRLTDARRYRDVWEMNDEEAKALVRKVLQADRIIHEQQLGMPWAPPDIAALRTPGAGDVATAALAADGPLGPLLAAKGSGTDDGGIGDDEPVGELRREGGGGDVRGAVGLAARVQVAHGGGRTQKRALELLSSEAGFLVEEKLQRLLAPLQRDEQSLMKLDAIFKALGVESVHDIDRLTSYFVVPGKQPSTQQQWPPRDQEDGEHGDAEAGGADPADGIEDVPTLIHPNDVVKAIRRFMEDQMHEKETGKNQADGSKQEAGAAAKDGLFRRVTHSLRLMCFADGEHFVDDEGGSEYARESTSEGSQLRREYWEQLANVLDDKKYRTWTAVFAAMDKYHTQLAERWKLTQEIKSYSQQNEELKSLLRQYMAAK
ncbi:hypothetical protein HK405_003226 [Cladochytrium tenue]|nr:hypothetical protein HK405_003226 [Cladochytrium tenue]